MKYRGPDGWLHDDSVEKKPPQVSTPVAQSASEETRGSKGSPAGCVMALLILFVPTPVLAGMGTIFFGFGGFVAGVGLGLFVTLAILLVAVASVEKKTPPQE
jgi:hypothetical protein